MEDTGMDLDLITFKALSAPTRVRILDALQQGGKTPGALSEELEKSKSTISFHLDVLRDAELVQKQEEADRRRVTYRSTAEADTIINEGEQQVTFSLGLERYQ